MKTSTILALLHWVFLSVTISAWDEYYFVLLLLLFYFLLFDMLLIQSSSQWPPVPPFPHLTLCRHLLTVCRTTLEEC